MLATAALVTAIAALLSAVAWPILIVVIAIIFRVQLRTAFEQVPQFMQRAEKAKVGFVEIELRKQAEASLLVSENDQGRISLEQLTAAARLEVETKSIPPLELSKQVERLCIEYELIRQTLPSGTERTRAMNRIMAQMRVIGPSVVKSLAAMKRSESAGHRLLAIAIMQIETHQADLPWIEERFVNEAPFIFYQASLLLNTLSQTRLELKLVLLAIAKRAYATVEQFSGVPDESTLDVLGSIITKLG